MFLLIQYTGKLWTATSMIYIPLCFYLYVNDSFIMSRDEYLHSTMFLLIQRKESDLPACRRIYIPLCFYLYPLTARACSSVLFNLHSTMFLLIPGKVEVMKMKKEIYIPLCFYLYSCIGKKATDPSIFTFHYVSTYTTLPKTTVRWAYLFTFHYVSTYT